MNPIACIASAQAYSHESQSPQSTGFATASAQSILSRSQLSQSTNSSRASSVSNKRRHESPGFSDWEEVTTPKRRRRDSETSSTAQLRSAILDLEALVNRLIAKNVQLKQTRSRVLREGIDLAREVDPLINQASRTPGLQYIAAQNELTSLREKMKAADRRSRALEGLRVQEMVRGENMCLRSLDLERILQAIAQSTHRYL